MAYANERLGDFFLSRHQPEQAIKFFDEALAVWTQLNDRGGQAAVWARLSEGYTLTNKPDMAIEFGEKAVVHSQRVGVYSDSANGCRVVVSGLSSGQPARSGTGHV